MDRTLTFGKYKGKPIKLIILTHIGYIMWCLNNIDWFVLTPEEQAVYDAIAITIKKYKRQMVFPTEEMLKHVKNVEALASEETPFKLIGNNFIAKDKQNPIIKSVIKYAERRERSVCDSELLPLIHHYMCAGVPNDENLGVVEEDWISDDMEWYQHF